MTFRIVERRHRADLDFLFAEDLEIKGPDGATHHRIVVRHPGASAVVLVDGDDVIMVRQYRAAVDREMLEIPAGKLDAGEDPESAAVREAVEETGHKPTVVQHLTSMHTGPGFTDEVVHIYLGTNLEREPNDPHGPEERAAEILRVALADVSDLIDQGSITDAKTIAGLLVAKEALA